MGCPEKVENPSTDVKWRLNNLYWIKDKAGNKIRFKLNSSQEDLLDNMWYLNVVLKARQRGFTTFIDIFMLDACIWNSNTSAGIIAHTRDDAKVIFREKIKFPYDNLADEIKEACPAILDSAETMTFGNGSQIRVGTSLRSGTLQYLHISEHGKICAKYPDKAREIKTGALNTVQAGQFIFIESTAEGRSGDFYDFSQEAERLKVAQKPLTKLDFKFHFYPWFEDEEYILDPEMVVLSVEEKDYFQELEDKHGIKLSPEQKAWYVKKARQQGDDMKREYPSTSKEAFEAAIEGSIFSKQMALIRRKKQICHVPPQPALPVHSFWDLGVNDDTTIWLMQVISANQYNVVGYYENSGEGFAHYKAWLDDWRNKNLCAFGKHYGPHDLEKRLQGVEVKTQKQLATEAGIPFVVVPRISEEKDGYTASRNAIPNCWFDESACATGITHLDSYRKEWDDKLGVWKDKPMHDSASHGAKGFETFAVAVQRDMLNTKPKVQRAPRRGTTV